jgi:hypothetical protein
MRDTIASKLDIYRIPFEHIFVHIWINLTQSVITLSRTVLFL